MSYGADLKDMIRRAPQGESVTVFPARSLGAPRYSGTSKGAVCRTSAEAAASEAARGEHSHRLTLHRVLNPFNRCRESQAQMPG